MWPDRVSNQGPLVLESDALSTALRGLAATVKVPLTKQEFCIIIFREQTDAEFQNAKPITNIGVYF